MNNPLNPLKFIHSYAEKAKLRRIFCDFREYTMLTEEVYINTLELATTVSNIPGCVVQCGVWRGGLIAGLSRILGNSRTYLLFDSFQGLPPAQDIDGRRAISWQSDTQGPTYYDNCSAPAEFADHAMQLAGSSSYHIVPGWFEETLPTFNFEETIAVLHLDADWYESTMTCLSCLFDRVAPGGIIIFDDYYTWDGCSRALHEYLAKRHLLERIRSHGSICYLKKQTDE